MHKYERQFLLTAIREPKKWHRVLFTHETRSIRRALLDVENNGNGEYDYRLPQFGAKT